MASRAQGEQAAQEARIPNRLKRKADIHPTNPTTEAPKFKGVASRPGPSRTRDQACKLNPEGFFEVHVQYDKCVDLVYNLGLKTADVIQTIEEDNATRQAEHTTQARQSLDAQQDEARQGQGPQQEGFQDEQAQVRFDYTDTDDDLGSGEK